MLKRQPSAEMADPPDWPAGNRPPFQFCEERAAGTKQTSKHLCADAPHPCPVPPASKQHHAHLAR
jgi:hypothetical protein